MRGNAKPRRNREKGNEKSEFRQTDTQRKWTGNIVAHAFRPNIGNISAIAAALSS